MFCVAIGDSAILQSGDVVIEGDSSFMAWKGS